jgi:hypothetical protein
MLVLYEIQGAESGVDMYLHTRPYGVTTQKSNHIFNLYLSVFVCVCSKINHSSWEKIKEMINIL